MVRFADRYQKEHGHVDYFVFGHRHILVDRKTGNGSRLIVLGDGFRLMSYGVWDGDKFELKSME